MSLKRSVNKKSQQDDPQPEKKVNTGSGSHFKPVYTKLFINNEWVDSLDGRTIDVFNPATEAKICTVSRAGDADAELAIKAARKCFDDPKSEWRQMSAHKRGNLIHKLADLIEQHADELADLEAQDNGKPFSVAKSVDVGLAIKTYRYYAGWCDKITGKTIPIEGPFFCYTREEPVGVCAQIIPWNFPLLMQAWKWGPCLAAGCVSIMKTSEKTPLSALRIAQLAKDAGFPAGVVQVLSGYGDVGAYLVKSPLVDKIAFTGSTKVGYGIMKDSPNGNLKRVTLELGGKSPNIICHDADIDKSVAQSQLAIFLNQGQCCIAGSRLFVHEKIYDEFVAKSVEAAKKIKIGDPFDSNTQHGPQVDKIQYDSIMGYIESGKTEGAKCLTGGQRYGNKGYYIEPTVFSDCQDNMKFIQEEIFGPVMQILKFSDYDEVIQRANDSIYGLGAGIMTSSIETYQKLANGIRAGTVYVNCYDVFDCNAPFGGFKSSGLGRELGEAGLKNYLESKTVIVKRGEDSLQ